MDLTPQQYYSALKAQDARFDGRFYICVTSTGIYCRPICPARTTKFDNCIFVRTAAEAEMAGYRPCLRCRPETAPGSPARMGTGATIRRALRLIGEAPDEVNSLEELSDRLGISSRHLRRLFKKELGATPKSILQTERFAVARQLLVETDLQISQVAFASGFGSIRRFNAAMRNAFRVTPGEFRRRRRRTPVSGSGVRLMLGYRPPYAWYEMLAYLGARAIPGIECVTQTAYERTIAIREHSGTLSVKKDPTQNRLVVAFAMSGPVVLTEAIQRVRDMFDLDASPEDISEFLGTDPYLAPRVGACPGIRIPGAWDVFELTVRTVVGQKMTVAGARTILGRLVDCFGRPLTSAPKSADECTPDRLFPKPSDLAGQDLQKLGISGSRAQTLSALAMAFDTDANFVHPAMEIEEARRRLLTIPGVGPWTAECVALRGLRDPDAFPDTDMALLNASGCKKAATLRNLAESWRPWRGYAAQLLWIGASPK